LIFQTTGWRSGPAIDVSLDSSFTNVGAWYGRRRESDRRAIP
jgi:hypothetical protein